MCSERMGYGAVGSCERVDDRAGGSYGFLFHHEGEKSSVLLRKAYDVNSKACRQP